MKITAQDLLRLGVIDRIVTAPVGGAHRDAQAAIASAGNAIYAAFSDMRGMSPEQVREHRAEKFLAIGRNL